jgi:hypothetical protein
MAEQAKMTVYRSPSGRYHLRASCSGGGPSRHMIRMEITRDQFYEASRCPCLRTWRPARVVSDAEYRVGYQVGTEDSRRGRDHDARETTMSSARQEGYRDGYDDTQIARSCLP